jgi:hypothetical protein
MQSNGVEFYPDLVQQRGYVHSFWSDIADGPVKRVFRCVKASRTVLRISGHRGRHGS